MKKLAIVSTHPIQYNAPLFKLLTERKKIEIKVFYTFEQIQNNFYDSKFGKHIKWDIPLLDGYNFVFLKNTSKKPSLHNFFGINNPQIISEIKKWKADAVLVYGWNHKSHLSVLRHFKNKIPVFFRGDSTLLNETKSLKNIFRRIWLTLVYNNIDKAFFVGLENKKYYQKFGLKENQLVFAPHAIDNNRFSDNTIDYKKQAEKWKKELLLNDNDFVFLYVGKFEKVKNLHLLIDASKRLKECKFIFVGNGELENELKFKAEENVVFIPFQNQSMMPIVYRLGDVLVLPSYSETWGLVVNEAMACGLPIVLSSKVGCAVDLLKEGVNGYVFESDNLEDLILKLNKISKNKSEIINFEKKSLEIIKSWTFEKVAEQIENSI